MERCRVLWNKVFLLFVYGPLFETSQENGDQKSRSSDVLRYQRYRQYTKKWSSLTLTKIWRRMFEELQLVQLISFYPTSRPLGFIFWNIFHNTRCPMIPETTLLLLKNFYKYLKQIYKKERNCTVGICTKRLHDKNFYRSKPVARTSCTTARPMAWACVLSNYCIIKAIWLALLVLVAKKLKSIQLPRGIFFCRTNYTCSDNWSRDFAQMEIRRKTISASKRFCNVNTFWSSSACICSQYSMFPRIRSHFSIWGLRKFLI